MGERAGIRGDVKGFIVADPGIRTGRHIAHHIAARFARGNSNCSEPAHQVRGVIDMHKMELNILPGGHMANRIGVLFRQIGKGVHLLGVEPPKGNFNAHHARRIPNRIRPFGEVVGGIVQGLLSRAVVTQAVIVALTIDAAPQPRFGKDFFIDFILAPQLKLGVVNGNFFVQLDRELSCQSIFPTGKLAHM